MIIAKEDVLRFLAQAAEIQCDHISVDMHVSPYEVIFNTFNYAPNPFEAGIISMDRTRYNPPAIGALVSRDDVPPASAEGLQRDAEKMSLFLYRQSFTHIGPRVLGDQMRLSGIKRCLLLPVFHPQSNGKAEMDFVSALYKDDARFLIGYCVPSTVGEDAIDDNLRWAKDRYQIKAVKLNANISALDLSTPAGKDRVEAILRACHSTGLPLVVHAGRSPVIRDVAARDFSSLKNLTAIDWNITRRPVILSHAGLMGASRSEIQGELLPELAGLLTAHRHLRIDIAALEISSLHQLLESVDLGRIVFGSDYPYFAQWGTIVKLLAVLNMVFGRSEEPFLKIVAANAESILSGEA